MQLLRFLNQNGRLPSSYITSDSAKRLGWSGRDSDSLWGLGQTNRKLIGGDSFNGGSALPGNVRWLSADIDVSRGYRGQKRLIYSPRSSARFISVDGNRSFLELSPCQ
ncbi:ribonuclease domain-containing protein [Alcaligenes phenolicus]